MAEHVFNQIENTLTLIFQGRLDTLKSDELQPVISEIVQSHLSIKSEIPLKITFDFGDVDFITSAFIRLCIVVVKKVGKEHFSIIKTNPLIKKTFKIALLDSELNVE